MPSVSVIIPVYNVEPYMARCARSLFGQTLQDIEFIFIDDCSPDRSIEIMREILETEFPTRKSQVKVFRMPQNSGQAKVRMQGISMATGDYVIHCDSDDEVAPFAYQMMYEKAVVDDLDIIVCDFILVKDGHEFIRSQYAEQGKEVQSIFFCQTMGSLWCRMIKNRVLDNLIAPIGNMTEDIVITVQAICNSRRIGYIHEPLYYYYIRDNSTTMNAGQEFDLSRWMQSSANARLLINLLVQRYGFNEDQPSVMYYKYRHRDALKAYVQIPKFYKMWKETFPEVDKCFLFMPNIPIIDKYWYLLIRLHLYYPWKNTTNAIRRMIYSRINAL